MAQVKSVSGEIDFFIPAIKKTCKTWYTVYGELGARRPLICAHGGPGAGHAYLRPLARLTADHGIPVILYDQVGCGNSTLLPETLGDTNFWTIDLFMDELDNLIRFFNIGDDYDFLGQSWGTILGSEYAITRQPKGMKHCVLSNGVTSGKLWIEAAQKLIDELPPDVRDTIRKHEASKTYDDPEFEKAAMVFYKRHVCRLDEWPKDLLESLSLLDLHNNPTVYLTMLVVFGPKCMKELSAVLTYNRNGPSEFTMIGPLKDWSVIGRLHKINVPTLVIHGEYDESTESVNVPFFKEIPKVKWVTVPNTSHTSWLEDPDRYFNILTAFLET